MTNAAAHSIPAEGLRHEAGDTVWTLNAVGCGGYSLNIRTSGAKTGGDWFQFSTHALDAWNAIVGANPVPAEVAPVRLQPAAKGTTTFMSPAEVDLVTGALTHTGGRITRGKLDIGSAPITVLHAMARRGYVTLTHPAGSPFRPDGAIVTDYGQRTAERHAPIAA